MKLIGVALRVLESRVSKTINFAPFGLAVDDALRVRIEIMTRLEVRAK